MLSVCVEYCISLYRKLINAVAISGYPIFTITLSVHVLIMHLKGKKAIHISLEIELFVMWRM